MEAPAPDRQARRVSTPLTFTRPIIELAVPARMRQSGGLRRAYSAPHVRHYDGLQTHRLRIFDQPEQHFTRSRNLFS